MRIWRRILLAGLTAAMLAGCDAGGVELGQDWNGSQVFILATVNGQRVIAGVNPVDGKSEALAVIPSQANDDDALAPTIAKLADGRWITIVRKKDGEASQFYEIDVPVRELRRIGTIQGGRTIVPAGTFLATVDSTSTDVNVIDSRSWSVARSVHGSVLPEFAKASDGSVLCIAQATGQDITAEAISLSNGEVVHSGKIVNAAATTIGCRGQRPLVVLSGATGEARTDKAKVTFKTGENGIDQITVEGAAGTALLLLGDSAYIALSNNVHTEIVELNLSTGTETRRIKVDGIPTTRGIYSTPSGVLLVIGDAAAAAVNPSTSKVSMISLPGNLLAAPAT